MFLVVFIRHEVLFVFLIFCFSALVFLCFCAFVLPLRWFNRPCPPNRRASIEPINFIISIIFLSVITGILFCHPRAWPCERTRPGDPVLSASQRLLWLRWFNPLGWTPKFAISICWFNRPCLPADRHSPISIYFHLFLPANCLLITDFALVPC